MFASFLKIPQSGGYVRVLSGVKMSLWKRLVFSDLCVAGCCVCSGRELGLCKVLVEMLKHLVE